jgi:hypothetical protein
MIGPATSIPTRAMKCPSLSPTLLSLPFAAFLLFLASCAEAPPPKPLMTALAPLPAQDYATLRISGRETLTVAPSVTVHADHQAPQADGSIALSGRVYLDGTQRSASDRLWPQHAYSDEAVWDSSHGILTMTGSAACEFTSSRIVATSPETRLVFDGHQYRTEGQSRMELLSPPPKKKEPAVKTEPPSPAGPPAPASPPSADQSPTKAS